MRLRSPEPIGRRLWAAALDLATGVIDQATIGGVFQAVGMVMICVALTLAEFLAVALLVAPRTVARKLLSLLRALLRRAGRIARAPSPPRPSREGT